MGGNGSHGELTKEYIKESLSEKGLGQLLLSAQRLAHKHPEVLKSESEIPEESKEKYLIYNTILEELDERGIKYMQKY